MFYILVCFAQAYEFHWDIDLVSDSYDDATLGCAVELGQENTAYIYGSLERPGLADGVLPRCGVEHQQYLVGRAGNFASYHVADFRKLSHQIFLRVKSACRVHQQHVRSAGGCGVAGVEDDRGRVLPAASDDITAYSLSPYRQLFHRCGPESVSCSQDNLLALLLELIGQLGNGGGFSRSVYPRYEDHRRAYLGEVHAAVRLGPIFFQLGLEEIQHVIAFCDPAIPLGCVEVVAYLPRRPQAYVRLNEHSLEFVHQLGIESLAHKQRS